MPNARPRALPRTPRRINPTPVDEGKVQALEARLEAAEAGNDLVGQAATEAAPASGPAKDLASVGPAPEAPSASAAPATPIVAVVPDAPQIPAATKPKGRKPAKAQSRQGTKAHPHIRRDGQATRATTVHFPVELHQELRLKGAMLDRGLSDIVGEAVADWLRRKAG